MLLHLHLKLHLTNLFYVFFCIGKFLNGHNFDFDMYHGVWQSVLKDWMCRNPTLKECEDDTHIPEMGTWESSRTPENSELDCRGQNTLPWGVFYTVEKVLKRRCWKWPCMSHSDICNTSYVRKKGRESNWQFDSRPLKVGNWPDPSGCRWSAIHCWKALKESYKFVSNLIPIGGLSKELWAAKVPGVQTRTVSGLPLGSLGTKSHLDVAPVEWRIIYYMGEGGGFPRVRAVMSQMSLELPMACSSTKGAPKCELTNLLVGLMQVWISE